MCVFCNYTNTLSCGDASDSLLSCSLSIFTLNGSLAQLSLGHLCKWKLRHGEPEGFLSNDMSIWREMGVSLQCECCSPSTDPPSCSILGHHCRVPKKLHNSSPSACRVLPLEVLWLEFRVKNFRNDCHFLILGVWKTNPGSSKPKSFSFPPRKKIPFSTSSCSLSLLKSLSRNQLGSSHVFHSPSLVPRLERVWLEHLVIVEVYGDLKQIFLIK